MDRFLNILWQGGGRGVAGLATCWLRPQASHGLPHFNHASLRIITQGCLGLKELANDRQGELGKLGLAKDRHDLCGRLEARNGLRERDG